MDDRHRPEQASPGPLFETDNAPHLSLAQPSDRLASAARLSGDKRMAGIIGLSVAIGLWGAWVTREVTRPEATPRFVRVQLSSMIGEYVSAQARTQTPPDTVTAQTKAFMRAVQRNLEVRGAQGQIVLVGEAVLAGDVPDVTQAVRREVYARIPVPGAGGGDHRGASSPVMDAMREAMVQPAGRARPVTLTEDRESDAAPR